MTRKELRRAERDAKKQRKVTSQQLRHQQAHGGATAAGSAASGGAAAAPPAAGAKRAAPHAPPSAAAAAKRARRGDVAPAAAPDAPPAPGSKRAKHGSAAPGGPHKPAAPTKFEQHVAKGARFGSGARRWPAADPLSKKCDHWEPAGTPAAACPAAGRPTLAACCACCAPAGPDTSQAAFEADTAEERRLAKLLGIKKRKASCCLPWAGGLASGPS
jgi:hypothetical protein